MAEDQAIRLWGRTFRALRHRNFRLFWTGQLVSLVGTWMQSIAQGWLVLRLTDSAWLLGLVSAAGSLPILFLSLPGGVAADRVDKRRLLLVTQATSMALALTLALLTATGWVRVWHIMVLAFGLGVVNAFDVPGRQSFVIELVGPDDLLNAIALNSSIFNGARIAGPALAGILIGLVGEAGCFLFNCLSYLAVLASLLLMELPPRNPPLTAESAWTRLVEGLRYLVAEPILLVLEGLIGLYSVFALSYVVLMPIFARDILRTDSRGFGLLMAATGVGALAGALTLASLGDFRRRGRLVMAGALALPAFLLAFSFSRSFHLSLALLVGAGWAMITHAATTNTLIQARVPDRLRGRVMSVYALMFLGMSPLGALQAGAVANALGAPAAVRIGVLLSGGAALTLFWRLPQLRRLQ